MYASLCETSVPSAIVALGDEDLVCVCVGDAGAKRGTLQASVLLTEDVGVGAAEWNVSQDVERFLRQTQPRTLVLQSLPSCAHHDPMRGPARKILLVKMVPPQCRYLYRKHYLEYSQNEPLSLRRASQLSSIGQRKNDSSRLEDGARCTLNLKRL